ncbi:hypothetical protein [Pontibacter rugosus]
MSRLRHITAAAILTFSSFAAFAQGEKNNWYFGKGAGIIFSGDTATATNSRLFTEEGSATSPMQTANF